MPCSRRAACHRQTMQVLLLPIFVLLQIAKFEYLKIYFNNTLVLYFVENLLPLQLLQR